jgi:hypothetical protein
VPETALKDPAILRTQHVLSTCMIKGEPMLEEVLSEPIVLLRARSAGLSPDALRRLCHEVRQGLRRQLHGSAP